MAKAKPPVAAAPPVDQAPDIPASDAGPASISEAMGQIQRARVVAGEAPLVNGDELEAEARRQFPTLSNP